MSTKPKPPEGDHEWSAERDVGGEYFCPRCATGIVQMVENGPWQAIGADGFEPVRSCEETRARIVPLVYTILGLLERSGLTFWQGQLAITECSRMLAESAARVKAEIDARSTSSSQRPPSRLS